MEQPIEYLKKRDGKLAGIIELYDPPLLSSSGNVFEDIVSCIIDMQIQYRGNMVRFKKLKALLNDQTITSDNLFSVRDADLASINMSGQKYRALVNLTTYWQENDLNDMVWHAMSDEAIRDTLSKIKGVGNWTIDMVMLFTLKRPDVFPIDDFHLKRIIKEVYQISDKEDLKTEMRHISDNWKPYRSTAVLYLLQSRGNIKR